MSRFATALLTCVIAMVLASGTALTPAPAEAAKMSKADQIALKDAVKGCKAEAKGKNIKWYRWVKRRKYINDCVTGGSQGAPKHHPIDQVQSKSPDRRVGSACGVQAQRAVIPLW